MLSRGNATCREMPRVFAWKSHGPSRGKEPFHGKFWHLPRKPRVVTHVETRVKGEVIIVVYIYILYIYIIIYNIYIIYIYIIYIIYILGLQRIMALFRYSLINISISN